MHKWIITLALLGLTSACAHGSDRSASTSRASASSTGSLAPSPSTAAGEGVVSACGEAQVFFASGSADLDASARERLDTYAGCLSREEVDTIYVAGMTDPGGSAAANVVLGRSRAQSVATYLESVGCDTAFVIRSYGEVDSLQSEPLWPIERAASATGVSTP